MNNFKTSAFILVLFFARATVAQFSELSVTSKGQKMSYMSSLRGKTQLVQHKQIKLLKLMGMPFRRTEAAKATPSA